MFGGDGGGKETLRGAVIVLVVGLVLGVSYNALARMGRPPRGLAWISQAPPPMPSLEALQPGAAPDTSVAWPSETEQPVQSPPSTPGATNPRTPGAASRTDRSPHNPPATTTPPAAGTTAPAPTSTASDLPVVPDVPGPIQLELPSFKKFFDAGAALIVDGREAEEYQEGHIAGALSLPYNDALADPDKVKNLDPGGRPIVVYCSGVTCEVALDLSNVLVKAGKRRVLVFKGGYAEWEKAGYPTTKGATP